MNMNTWLKQLLNKHIKLKKTFYMKDKDKKNEMNSHFALLKKVYLVKIFFLQTKKDLY